MNGVHENSDSDSIINSPEIHSKASNQLAHTISSNDSLNSGTITPTPSQKSRKSSFSSDSDSIVNSPYKEDDFSLICYILKLSENYRLIRRVPRLNNEFEYYLIETSLESGPLDVDHKDQIRGYLSTQDFTTYLKEWIDVLGTFPHTRVAISLNHRKQATIDKYGTINIPIEKFHERKIFEVVNRCLVFIKKAVRGEINDDYMVMNGIKLVHLDKKQQFQLHECEKNIYIIASVSYTTNDYDGSMYIESIRFHLEYVPTNYMPPFENDWNQTDFIEEAKQSVSYSSCPSWLNEILSSCNSFMSYWIENVEIFSELRDVYVAYLYVSANIKRDDSPYHDNNQIAKNQELYSFDAPFFVEPESAFEKEIFGGSSHLFDIIPTMIFLRNGDHNTSLVMKSKDIIPIEIVAACGDIRTTRIPMILSNTMREFKLSELFDIPRLLKLPYSVTSMTIFAQSSLTANQVRDELVSNFSFNENADIHNDSHTKRGLNTLCDMFLPELDEKTFHDTVIYTKNEKIYIAKFTGYSQLQSQSQQKQNQQKYANYSLSHGMTIIANDNDDNKNDDDNDVENRKIVEYIRDLSSILSENPQHLTNPCERLYVCYMDEQEHRSYDTFNTRSSNILKEGENERYNTYDHENSSIISGNTSHSANTLSTTTLSDSGSVQFLTSDRDNMKNQLVEQARYINSKPEKSNSSSLLSTSAGKVMIEATRWMKDLIQRLCQDKFQACKQYLKYFWLIPTGYFFSKNGVFDARCVSFRIAYVDHRTFDDDHDKYSNTNDSSNSNSHDKDRRLEFISKEKIPSFVQSIVDMMNRNMESYMNEYPVLKELRNVYIAFNYIASNQAESSQNQSDHVSNHSKDTNASSGQRSHEGTREEKLSLSLVSSSVSTLSSSLVSTSVSSSVSTLSSSLISISTQTEEEKLAGGMNRLDCSSASVGGGVGGSVGGSVGISLVLDGDYQSNICYPGKDFDWLEPERTYESIKGGKSHFQVQAVNYKQYSNVGEKYRISSSTSNSSSNSKSNKDCSINDEEQVSKIVNILYPSDISVDKFDKLIEEAMNRKSKIQNTKLLIEESVSNNPVPSKDKESTKDIKSETEKTDPETISEDINSVNTTTPTRSIETEESKLFLKMVHGIKGKDDIYPKDWVADISNSVIQLCIAKVIHDMIIADQSIPRSNDARFIVFDHYPVLAGNYELHIQEHVYSISGSLVPSEDIPLPSTIFLFIQALSNMVGMDDICNLIAIIYLNRLQTRTSLVLSKANYRSLWLVAVDVAQKTWQEKPKRTKDFERYFSNTRISLLRNMEQVFLNSINVEVRIAPEVYAKYYHGLKLAHDRIFGMKSGRRWNEKLDVQSTANIDPNTMDSKAIRKNSNDTNTSNDINTSKSRGSLSSGETDGSTSTNTAASESSSNSSKIKDSVKVSSRNSSSSKASTDSSGSSTNTNSSESSSKSSSKSKRKPTSSSSEDYDDDNSSVCSTTTQASDGDGGIADLEGLEDGSKPKHKSKRMTGTRSNLKINRTTAKKTLETIDESENSNENSNEEEEEEEEKEEEEEEEQEEENLSSSHAHTSTLNTDTSTSKKMVHDIYDENTISTVGSTTAKTDTSKSTDSLNGSNSDYHGHNHDHNESKLSSSLSELSISKHQEILEKFHELLLMERKRNPSSLKVASLYTDIANTHKTMNDLSEAASFYRKAMEIEEIEAPSTLRLAKTYSNLATEDLNLGLYRDAIICYSKGLMIEEKLNPDKLSIATGYSNIGNVYHHQQNFTEALKYYIKALEIEVKYASGTLSVATSHSNIGNIYQNRGNWREALSQYQTALSIQERCVPDSLAVATTCVNIGFVYKEMERWDDALHYYTKAVNIEEKFDSSSSTVQTLYGTIGALYAKLQSKSKAKSR